MNGRYHAICHREKEVREWAASWAQRYIEAIQTKHALHWWLSRSAVKLSKHTAVRDMPTHAHTCPVRTSTSRLGDELMHAQHTRARSGLPAILLVKPLPPSPAGCTPCQYLGYISG